MDRAGTVLDWAATVVTGAASWTVLLAFDVLQRLARPFGGRAHQHVVTSMARWLHRAARLGGTRFLYLGRENVVPGRPYIIVANHQSLFDLTMTSDYLAALQPRFVTRNELVRGYPGISYSLRHGGSVCVDRGESRRATLALDRLARRIVEDGWSVVLFPEGQHSTSGAMRPFQAAALRTLLARAPGIAVLPVSISGGARLWSRRLRPYNRSVTLTYRVHPPLAPPDPSDARAFSSFLRHVERTIRNGLPPEEPLVTRSAASPAGPP